MFKLKRITSTVLKINTLHPLPKVNIHVRLKPQWGTALELNGL